MDQIVRFHWFLDAVGDKFLMTVHRRPCPCWGDCQGPTWETGISPRFNFTRARLASRNIHKGNSPNVVKAPHSEAAFPNTDWEAVDQVFWLKYGPKNRKTGFLPANIGLGGF